MFTAWHFKGVPKFHMNSKMKEKVFCRTLAIGYQDKDFVLRLNHAKNIL